MHKGCIDTIQYQRGTIVTILISKLIGPDSLFSGWQGNKNKSSIFARIEAGLVFLSGRLARRRSRNVLVGLDDRMLSDIGITRCQAEEEAKQDFWN